MTTQYLILAVTLIVATPAFATGGPSGGGASSSNTSASSGNSGGSHAGGGGGSGGGHVGGGGGGAGHIGAGLGGRGAAASARDATVGAHGWQHPGDARGDARAMHTGRASEGKRAEAKRMGMEPAKMMGGMHHHHHHHFIRDQPRFDELEPMRYSSCIQFIDPDKYWHDCFAPTKTAAHGAKSRS